MTNKLFKIGGTLAQIALVLLVGYRLCSKPDLSYDKSKYKEYNLEGKIIAYNKQNEDNLPKLIVTNTKEGKQTRYYIKDSTINEIKEYEKILKIYAETSNKYSNKNTKDKEIINYANRKYHNYYLPKIDSIDKIQDKKRLEDTLRERIEEIHKKDSINKVNEIKEQERINKIIKNL